jgi:hypothetical protein
MTKAHPTENDVKAAVTKVLKKHDLFWWANPATKFSQSGISDRCAIWMGTFFAIEIKLDVKKSGPTERQKAFLVSIQSEGGLGFVVDAERVPLLDEFLTRFRAAAERVQRGELEIPEETMRMMELFRALSWEVA